MNRFFIKEIVKFTKKLLPVRFKTFLKKFRKFNAINNLDVKLLNHLNFKNGFFIECGANDGVNQSNTWYFEKHLNWKGLLIEPHKNLFKELVKNRSKKNIFINSCLVSKNYKKEHIFLSDKNLESRVMNNFDQSNARVDTTTLEQIFINKKISQKIDLLSLDVEGYEFEVLKGIDLNKFNIEHILVETNNLVLMKDFLEKFNYKYIESFSFHDFFFKKNKE